MAIIKMTTKQFWKTSEFWVVVLTATGAFTASIVEMLDPKWAAVVISLSGMAYAISRGISKINQK